MKMVSNLMIVAAVPFCAARLPATTFGRNIVRKASAISKYERKDDNSNEPPRKRRRNVPVEERLRMRQMRNRESAQVSRDRAKLQKDLLEKQLLELKYEKMKLLLENDCLQKQNHELEEENGSLKLRVQNLHVIENDRGVEVEVAVKHAWFVSIPLLKEWALSKIVFILMISMLESLNANFWTNKFSIPHFNLQGLTNSPKPLVSLLCFPWKSLIHQMISPQRLMIFNG